MTLPPPSAAVAAGAGGCQPGRRRTRAAHHVPGPALAGNGERGRLVLKARSETVYSLGGNSGRVSAMRQLCSTFLAVLWFSVASHCFVASAFASPVKTAHRCCPGEKPAPSDPHRGCPQRVCCESFAPMVVDLPDLSASNTVIALPCLPVLFSGSVTVVDPTTPRDVRPSAEGPPGTPISLLGPLTLAQNAPPR